MWAKQSTADRQQSLPGIRDRNNSFSFSKFRVLICKKRIRVFFFIAMEVGRRPDESSTLWDPTISSSCCSLKSTTSANSLIAPPDATGSSSPDHRPTQRVTTGDIIDELLEAFHRNWMTLRPKGRVQSDTIWRNGKRVEQRLTC